MKTETFDESFSRIHWKRAKSEPTENLKFLRHFDYGSSSVCQIRDEKIFFSANSREDFTSYFERLAVTPGHELSTNVVTEGKRPRSTGFEKVRIRLGLILFSSRKNGTRERQERARSKHILESCSSAILLDGRRFHDVNDTASKQLQMQPIWRRKKERENWLRCRLSLVQSAHSCGLFESMRISSSVAYSLSSFPFLRSIVRVNRYNWGWSHRTHRMHQPSHAFSGHSDPKITVRLNYVTFFL